jgi:MFS family permease
VPTAGTDASPPSVGYARYVLGVLLAMYVFNYLDRYLLAVVVLEIQAELGTSDDVIGFLLGPAFGVLYAVAGIPIGRWADRASRTGILALGLTTWSLMTAACGLARSSLQLAVARVGVGIGEAAGTAPAHSLISDYFPPQRRARALGVLQVGVYLGTMLGTLVGGALVGPLGWRGVFLAAGLPGVALALLLWTTVREPPRGALEARVDTGPAPALGEVLRVLWRLRSFRYLALGTGLAAFAGTGFGVWMPTFLRRVHDFSPVQVGLAYGVINSGSAALGSLLGGWLADRLGRRDVRWWAWVAAGIVLLSLPFLLGVVLWPSAVGALVLFVPAGIVGGGWAPCAYAAAQNLVPPRMRALASSVLVLMATLLGMGAGPQAVGLLNVWLEPAFGIEAVRWSLAIVLLTSVVGGGLFLLAGRYLVGDLAQQAARAA